MTIDKKCVELKEQGKTFREIKDELNLSSTSLVHYYIKRANYDGVSVAELREENYHLKKKVQKLTLKLKKIKKLLTQ